MTRSTFALLMTFACVTGACGLFSSGPQGQSSDIAKQAAAVLAPGAEVKDQPFEDLLSRLDLQKTYGARADEVVDQIRKTRVAVATASRKSSASGGFRLASVVRSVGTFSIPAFAAALALSLDTATKQSGTRQNDPAPYKSTEQGSTTTTATTLKISETFTGSGAHVQATQSWSYHSTTTENATGATLVDLTDERTLTGGIDVCPDAAGNVPASVDVRAALVARTTSSTTTRNATSTGTFRGTVDEQATLRSVSQQNSDQTQWESAAGNGGFSGSHSATWNVSGSGDYLGGLDSSSVTASVTTTGDATAADANTMAGWDFALDAYALEAAYKAAQDLWRHGRCVMVAAPDYSAETPIEVSAQESSQHQEEVDTGSETKFSVRLKHRFGGSALSQPTMASLTSGDKKLEPSKLEGSGGQLTYTAPDDPDKNATVQMKTVSKRGIGTLVITFRTADSDLAISGSGSVKLTTGSPVSYTGNITIGPVALKKRDATTYAGAGPIKVHWDVIFEGIDLGNCRVYIDVEGTTGVTAMLEKRGNDSVWVVRPDPLGGGGETSTGGYCLGSASVFNPPGGGWGTQFFQAAGDLVIPHDGGTVPA
nr:hypothetical protein [Chloroflexota bacterium]